MRKSKSIAVLFAVLAGCYVQLQDPSITMTHRLCSPSTSNCVPGGPLLGAILVNTANTFVVDFGNQPLLTPSSDLGPATLKTSLLLNGGGFDMITAGEDFSGVNTATLYAVNPGVSTAGDPCATTSNCTVIAAYDKTRDGAATRHLALKGNGTDLLTLIDPTSHQLALEIRASASGTAPAGSWNADVSMDMALTSRANLP